MQAAGAKKKYSEKNASDHAVLPLTDSGSDRNNERAASLDSPPVNKVKWDVLLCRQRVAMASNVVV